MLGAIDGGREMKQAQEWQSSTCSSSPPQDSAVGKCHLPAGKDESLIPCNALTDRKIIQRSPVFERVLTSFLDQEKCGNVLHVSTLRKCTWESRPKTTNDLTPHVCVACQKSSPSSPFTLAERRQRLSLKNLCFVQSVSLEKPLLNGKVSLSIMFIYFLHGLGR